MKKKTITELIGQYQNNCARINEIADVCEREKRERNESENAEYQSLCRENNILQMRLAGASSDKYQQAVPEVDTDKLIRERLLSENKKVVVEVMREDVVTPQTTAALSETGIIPTSEQTLIEPIRKGLIWDKVGISVRTDLVGTLRWPYHTKAVASFADEGERAVDSKVDWSKLDMSGKRITVAIPVTREELENSNGIVNNVVNSEAPAAVVDLINDSLFTTTGKYTAADGTEKDMKNYGPFKALADSPTVTFASTDTPTRKELLKLKAAVSSKIDLVAPCWVMTENMKTVLEDVKVDAGSGRFLCENDSILGYPVFTTNAIGESYIGFGDWSYQAAGFFGQASFIADPYTLARRNSVDFVLNTHFGMVTLRTEAFALGKLKTV